MRWKKFGVIPTDGCHRAYFGGKEDKHEQGVGFLVHKDIVKSVIGCRPISSRLMTVRLLLDLATYNNLVLANTLGNHKPSRRGTWYSPDGTHHNQIDYILVKKRFLSGIKTTRTRTFPGADVGSDHDMVIMT